MTPTRSLPLIADRRARLDATDLARVAVLAAVVAVLGLPGGISVFGGVPITAQTLGVMLAGAVLGARLGAIALAVLLALVAVGLPLLAGGTGGLGVFLGPTAGYLVGWILGAAVVGLIVHLGGRRPTAGRTAVAMVVGGIAVIYAVGIPVQSLVTRLPLAETVAASLVFLPGDIVKAAIATGVVMTLVRGYPRAFRRASGWTTGQRDTGAATLR
ncbi:biotin transporter BioY [Clavibacter michiganensis]|uniref:Biotin transporter n=1 Tax=Clavibacter michiganensis subsp. insidiosus TaxID=33014 RepID=A0A0D5CI37_9MICO|nr:BioY family transporter [Clavibacter michiganensis]AJW78954.1 biotin biosynthesis protein BioC [Clavibacter michiganensis subsp. insidiosus]AWF98363.1 BioY family transporter [Clavibacter michiganensis subsp. insidiosus]AWG01436.1 BioY family transporter [Clavibacter michiganensis subsp. insidiosus]OQJ60029.1 BioY family transporter [Clavibacter michiganensis subsp. insidiosus]RII85380.1 BioY family transporter [Clavibacter michiganensis subsp. insidiosus]